MKVVGLNGKTYTWKLNFNERNTKRKCSGPHEKARTLLAWCYPTERILEELLLPGSGKLYTDFFLPTRKLAIEVHGRQHYEFILHFHGSIAGFLASRSRDNGKRTWFNLNEIRLVELPDWETEDEWRQRILGDQPVERT